MPYPYIHPEKDAWKHVKERLASLLSFDEIRIMEILESLQFGIAYFFVGFVSGTLLDWAFPKFNEDETVWEVLRQVVIQSVLLILLIFYIRKFVKIMPFMFVLNFDANGDNKTDPYRPYKASEYGGEIMIAVAVIGAQFNLIKKLDFLSRKLYKLVFNEERMIGVSLGI
jgi:hypothetical protein